MSMSELEMEVYERYFMDGMKEEEIAEILGVSLLTVHEVISAIEDEMQSMAREAGDERKEG